MFFWMSTTGSLNFIPFVNSSKTVIFLSFLPVARGLFRPSLGHHRWGGSAPDRRRAAGPPGWVVYLASQ